MNRRTRELLRGSLSLAGLVLLLVGVPAFLIWAVRAVDPASGGWPLPHRVPSWIQVRDALDQRTVDAAVVVKIAATLAWLAWTQLAAAIIAELAAAIGRRPARRLPILGGFQRGAGHLVAGCALLFAASTPHARTTVPSLPPLAPTAAVAPAATTVTDSTTPTPAASGQGRVYVTTAGDGWWQLAETWLGDGTRWVELRDHNIGREVAPSVVIDATTTHLDGAAGWQLLVPDHIHLNDIAREPSIAPPATGTDIVIDIEPGDTLWGIAEAQLPAEATAADIVDEVNLIYQDNAGVPQADGRALQDPDLIYPGWTFTVHDRTAAAPVPAPEPPLPPPVAEPQPPPPPPPATPPTPATTTPTSTAPSSNITPVESDEDDGVDWRVVLVGGSAVTAAVVIAELERRRRRQALYRRTGQQLPAPTADAARVERQLREVADEEAADWVDATVRALTALWADQPDRPRPVLIRAGRRGVELVMDRPAIPPSGGIFEPGDHPHSWLLNPTVTLDQLRAEAGDAPPVAPALASIGRTPEGTVLANLEHPGTLAVTGHPQRTAAFLRGLVMELGTAPWARDTQVRTVGVDIDPDGLHDVQPMAEVADVVQWLHDEQRNLTDALDPDLQLVDARIDDNLAEAWLPAIAVIGKPLTHADLAAMASNPGDGAVTVVLADTTESGQWRLEFAADAPVTLEPLGMTMDAVGWEPDTADAADELLVTATAPTPPAPEKPPAPPPPETSDEFLASVLGARPIEVQILCDEPRLVGVDPDPQRLKGMAIPILVRLACTDRAISLRKLVEEIWPDQQVNVGSTARPTISRLRTALGKDNHGRYRLPVLTAGSLGPLSDEIGCDWRRFLTLVTAADSVDDDTARRYLTAALQLMNGEPFRTVTDRKYAYASDLRRDMQTVITDASRKLADLALAAGDPDLAIYAVTQGQLGDAKQLELFAVEAIAHGHAHRPDQVRRVREAAQHAIHTIDPTDDIPDWLTHQLDLAQQLASQADHPVATAD